MNKENANFKKLYAGRWVALVRGRVVAQGGTSEQALRASHSNRHKERPEIVFMPAPFSLPPILNKLKKAIPSDHEIYLVGGAVRDLYLSRFSPDLDFVLPANGISLARKVANTLQADFMSLDDDRDTGRVIITETDGSHFHLDFATYRGADLNADLRGRDFTINAIAYDLRDGTIIDPTEGAGDIRAKLIRACLPTSFSDDPVRILRGVRQAAAFGFMIDKSTREWMKQSADQITRISPERLRDEVFKMLEGPRADDSFRALEMLGVIDHLMPELIRMKGVEQSRPHHYDVWTHTLHVLRYLDHIVSVIFTKEKLDDPFANILHEKLARFEEKILEHYSASLNIERSHRSMLFFAALYHDVSKPETKTTNESGRIRFIDHDVRGTEVAALRARGFNLSNDEVERISQIVRHHMRIHSFANRLLNEKQMPSRRAVYRFFRDTGKAGVDLILLAFADLRGTYAEDLTMEAWVAYLDIASLLLENYLERPEEVVSPPRLVDGHELMKELRITPGPFVGKLLEAIRENQAEGLIQDREQALSYAREAISKKINENES